VRARSARFATAFAVVLLAAGTLGLSACGGDDETTTEPPTATIPTVEQTTSEPTTTEATTTTTDYGEVEAEPGDDGPGQGGDDDSIGPGSGGAAVPDTPENDVTPPANTPEGQFEQFCNENPGACG
jgi:hypothetical protein